MIKVEVDEVPEDLYRSSKVEVWSDLQGSSKDQGCQKTVSCREACSGAAVVSGTCIPCKVGSRPVFICNAAAKRNALMRKL